MTKTAKRIELMKLMAKHSKTDEPTGEVLLRGLRALEQMTDKVLSYRVPARTKKAKKRQRKRRAQRVSCI